MSRKLMLCVWACLTAGCMTTGGSLTSPPDEGATQTPSQPIPTLPAGIRVANLGGVSMNDVTHIVVTLSQANQHLEGIGVNVDRNTLPFHVDADGAEEIARFFTAAYRSGVPVVVYTGRIPVSRTPSTGAPAEGTLVTPLAAANNTGDTNTSPGDQPQGAGQTSTDPKQGGINGGHDPDWALYLSKVAISTANAVTSKYLK